MRILWGSIIGSLVGSLISRGSLFGALLGGYLGYVIEKKLMHRAMHQNNHKNTLFRRAQSHDPYEVLGVDKSDTLEKISSVYRELAKKYHPDILRAKGLSEDKLDEANRYMAKINAAWEEIKRHKNG